MDTAAPVLELRAVHKVYHIRKGLFGGSVPLRALNGASLVVRRGETVGLVGESGCGKSTLARLLLGLIPPSSGEILINGAPIDPRQRQTIARHIQPIFQDPYSSLNPRKTVRQIVRLPLDVHRIGTPEERARKVDDILDVVGLPRRSADSLPNQMSGGQRQRVAIARALIMRPEIVICDEPTSALDVSVQSQILNLLIDLRHQFGLTYLFISHNLAVVEHLADRVAVMYLGRIVEERGSAGLFARPGHPYSEALLASVLTPEPGLGIPDTHLGATFPNPIAPPPGCTFHPRCAYADDTCRQTPPGFDCFDDGAVACHHPLALKGH